MSYSRKMNLYHKYLKRFFDIFFSLALLIIFLPLLLLITLLLCLDFRCKPFFLQKRLGYKNKTFNIIKFRKLRDLHDTDGKLLPEHKRLTPLGHFLRKTSLDELPQLINILLGHMSFIGPRPFLYFYKPYYTPLELRRHYVRPGLTGWAQIHGRQILNWDKRLEYDLFYVNNLNLWLDIKIFFLTLKAVIRSFLRPSDNPIASFPRFVQHRAYIRMPWSEDDVDKLHKLFTKGEKKEMINVFDHHKDMILNRNFDDFIVLIDDFGNRYNSFVYATVKDEKIIVKDWYFSDGSYLAEKQMKQKYNDLLIRYITHLGIKHVKLINPL